MRLIVLLTFLFFTTSLTAQTGIGTTSPVNKFDIFAVKADPSSSGFSTNGNLRLGATVGTHVLDFGLSGTSTYSWLQARDKSNYGSNYILALNPNGGNIGIGKTAPSTALDVNGTITANAFSGTWSGTTIGVAYGGTGVVTTSANYIFAGPIGSSGAPSFRALVSADIPLQEVTDEFSANANQTSFTLSFQKSSKSIFKLYINGIRVSNTSCSATGTTFTYNPTNNNGYNLIAGDRIQIDYFY